MRTGVAATGVAVGVRTGVAAGVGVGVRTGVAAGVGVGVRTGVGDGVAAGVGDGVACAAAAVRFSDVNSPSLNVPVCWACTPPTVNVIVAPSVPQPGWVVAEATSTM